MLTPPQPTYPAAYVPRDQHTTTHLPGDPPTVPTHLGYPVSTSHLGRSTSRLPGASTGAPARSTPVLPGGPPQTGTAEPLSLHTKGGMDSKKTEGPRARLGAAAPVPPHRSVTRCPPRFAADEARRPRPKALCPSALPGIGTWPVPIHHGGGRPTGAPPRQWGGPAGGCGRFPLWTPLAGGAMGVLKTSRWRLTLS